jgi:hypothetical protein
MGKVYPSIDDRLAHFIHSQHLFFVGTAPAGVERHINLSPKGLDSLRILDPLTVAYLDLTGSGVETIAHLRENGRITLLFCAFAGAPKIVRLYGHGTVLEPASPDFEALRFHFPAYSAVRSIIRIARNRITDSCGFGVPLLRYEHERDQMPAWAAQQGERQILVYQREHNVSIDGLPGLRCHDLENQ